MSESLEMQGPAASERVSFQRVFAGTIIVNGATVVVESDFWVASTCVTQIQWQSMFGMNPSTPGDRRSGISPVNTVSWYESLAFCGEFNRYAEPDGLYRVQLPTLAQWLLWPSRRKTEGSHFERLRFVPIARSVQKSPCVRESRSPSRFRRCSRRAALTRRFPTSA
jgi:hypothetical protein